ncbi:MAG: hypothetical protein M3R00_04135, partial [Pseudomonadota bacterium]|nr:hypothetical protein [Pseudomonadota bacterium]
PLEETQYDESIAELLERIKTYESSWFFKRWYLSWCTTIHIDQVKLGLVYGHIQDNPHLFPVASSNTLLRQLQEKASRIPRQRKPNNAQHRWIQWGRVKSMVFSSAKTLWQGMIASIKEKFSRWQYYSSEVKSKAIETKRDLRFLYADASTNLLHRYLEEGITAPQAWQDVELKMRAKIKQDRKKLCGPFANPLSWQSESPELSRTSVYGQIKTLNTDFKKIVEQGENNIMQTKEQIKLLEEIRNQLKNIKNYARLEVAQYLSKNYSIELTLEYLENLRSMVENACTRSIILSRPSQQLQTLYGFTAEQLEVIFSKIELKIPAVLAKARKAIEKDCKEKVTEHVYHLSMQSHYRKLLTELALPLNLENSAEVNRTTIEANKVYKAFKASITENTRSNFNKQFVASSLLIWDKRIKNQLKANECWQKILLHHERYMQLLKESEDLSILFGFRPSPLRYRQLKEAHAERLRSLLVNYQGRYHLPLLLEKSEQLTHAFTKSITISEANHNKKGSLNTDKAQQNGLDSASVYKNYCLQLLHAAYECVTTKPVNFRDFSQQCQLKMQEFKTHLQEELKDSYTEVGQENAAFKNFELFCAPWDCRIHQLLSSDLKELEEFVKAASRLEMPNWQNELANYGDGINTALVNNLHELQAMGDAKKTSQAIKSLFSQENVDFLNGYLLKNNTETPEEFFILKTRINQYSQEVLLPQIENIVSAFAACSEEMRVKSVKNLCNKITDYGLLHQAVMRTVVDPDLRNLFDQHQRECQHMLHNLMLNMQDKAPFLRIFIKAIATKAWSEFKEKQLTPQEDILMSRKNTFFSFGALTEQSRLDSWINGNCKNYNHSIACEVITHIKADMSGLEVDTLIERLTQASDLNLAKLKERLYVRLAKESPELQWQGLQYANTYWTSNLYSSRYDIVEMVTVWRKSVGKPSVEWTDSENAECTGFFKELMQQRSGFWKRNLSEDKEKATRIIRWLRKEAHQKLKSLLSTARQEATIIQTHANKVVKYFKLIYHPDKVLGNEEAKSEIKETIFDFEKQVNEMLVITDNDNDRNLNGKLQENEKVLARYLQMIANDMQIKDLAIKLKRHEAKFINDITQLEASSAELKIMLARQAEKQASQEIELANLKEDSANIKVKIANNEVKLANNDEKLANQSEQIRQLFKMVGEVATNIPNNVNERERTNVSQGPNEVGQSVKEEESSFANDNHAAKSSTVISESDSSDAIQQPRNLKRAEVKSESSSPRFFSSGMQNDNHTPESLSNDKATASMS